MTRIPAPSWARPFERSVDARFGELELSRVLAQHEAVMAVVERVVQDYIDDRTLTVDNDALGFPSRDRLTREYYIGEESYGVNDEPWFQRVGRTCQYHFSVFACCLEHLRHANQTDQDYLDLEVHFRWLPDTGTFRYDGDVDSSSI